MTPTSTSHLTLSTNGWFIAIGLIVFIAAMGLGYWNWKRSSFNRGVAWLESLRLLIIGLIAFLLQEPEWVQIHNATEKPVLQVLVDRSRSMETADAADVTLPGHPMTSRAEATERLLAPEAWISLKDRFDVKIETFPSANATTNQDVAVTDISNTLTGVLQENSQVRAVVMVSDGDWNAGSPPAETAIDFRAADIPIHTISVGAETKLPDLELVDVDLPTFGVLEKTIRIPFSLGSSLIRDYSSQVTLEVNGQKVESKEVRIGPMSKAQDYFVWKPEEIGEQAIRVFITPYPEEALQDNNEIVNSINIREEKLKVLIIETYPRWEYRFLKNALSRDPGVEVSCLLLHQQLDKTGGGNRDYISAFPDEPEALAEYDVVFLGDVGIGEKQLTEEQCQMLKGIVEFQASGIVFLPGPYGFQSNLNQSPLEPLLPVVVDEIPGAGNSLAGRGDSTPMHMELTESGRRSLLTKLTDQEDTNSDIWSSLPGFQWYMPIVRAKAGAEVLAVHQQALNENGRLPLLVTKPFGVGKVLYMATDGAWRWRRGVEDLYHYRFWGQVVRWMAYQRHMNRGESIRFYYSPESPNVGQTLAMKVNVMNDAGEPLSTGNATAKIQSPSGKSSVVQLRSAGAESWGLFQGDFAVQEAGKHSVTLAASDTSQILEAEFTVLGSALERVGEPAKPYILQEVSKISRGQVFDLTQIASLQNMVMQMPDPPISIRRVPLWANVWVMTTVVGLLSLFWILRKRIGLL